MKTLKEGYDFITSGNWTKGSRDLSLKIDTGDVSKAIIESIEKAFPASLSRTPYCRRLKKEISPEELKSRKVVAREESSNYLFSAMFPCYVTNKSLPIKEICYKIRDIYTSYGFDYTLGNAQKLANIAVKYLFSWGKVNYNNNLFKGLYAPIDAKIIKKAKETLNLEIKDLAPWSKCEEFSLIEAFYTKLKELTKDYYESLLCWEIFNF